MVKDCYCCMHAIYSRDTAIRIYSVPRFRRKNPFVKIPSWAKVMGLAEYFCRPLFVWIFQIWPYPRQTPCSGPRRQPGHAWQASPWGHSPSSSAPCAVPMRLARVDQHIKDEPYARVGYRHKLAWSIYFGSPWNLLLSSLLSIESFLYCILLQYCSAQTQQEFGASASPLISKMRTFFNNRLRGF
jgi:hypothetical protein